MRRVRIKLRSVLGFPVAAVLLVAAAAYLTADVSPSPTGVYGSGALSVPTSDLRPGEVKFFSYRADPAREIRFLLARDSDGNLELSLIHISEPTRP